MFKALYNYLALESAETLWNRFGKKGLYERFNKFLKIFFWEVKALSASVITLYNSSMQNPMLQSDKLKLVQRQGTTKFVHKYAYILHKYAYIPFDLAALAICNNANFLHGKSK